MTENYCSAPFSEVTMPKDDFRSDTWADIISAISVFQQRGMQGTVEWLCDLLPCPPSSIPCNAKCEPKNELLEVKHPAAYQLLLRAKVYFDNGQYNRAANVMNDIYDKEISAALNHSSLAVFLHYYSKLLAERLRDQEHTMIDQKSPSTVKNKSAFIFIEESILESECIIDSPLLWLLGIAEKEQKHYEKARYYFIKAIQTNPFNWSAWQDLIHIVTVDRWYSAIQMTQSTKDDARNERSNKFTDVLADMSGMEALDGSSFESFIKFLQLSDQYTSRFGYCLYCMKSNRYRQAIHNFQILLENLWTCPHIIAQLAKCGFEIRCYELSLQMFHKLHDIDCYRFDYVEDLACIYMLRDQLEHLGELAKLCQDANRFSSSTSCVIGNYLAAQGIHEQAVNSFLKATKENRNDISAWILVGHEYSQMQEFSKALEAYRRATEIDSSDARAWFGIGIVYDVQQNYSLAIYNFQKACFYRPENCRFWYALGNCYTEIGRLDQAYESYIKAWQNGKRLEALCKVFQSSEEKLKNNGILPSKVALWAQKLFDRYLEEQHQETQAKYKNIYSGGIYDRDHINDFFLKRWTPRVEEDSLSTLKDISMTTRTLPLLAAVVEPSLPLLQEKNVTTREENNNTFSSELDAFSLDFSVSPSYNLNSHQIIKWFRNAPAAVHDAAAFLMKHHQALNNKKKMVELALLITETGGQGCLLLFCFSSLL